MNDIDIVPNQGVETIGMQHINMKIRLLDFFFERVELNLMRVYVIFLFFAWFLQGQSEEEPSVCIQSQE